MPAMSLAAALVDELVRCGVNDAVLCPGSRSAPLAYALHEAHTAGRLRLHVRVDERVAGFVALGLAKGTGRVVPVVTTSGTAAANLHPAVLEADAAGVPLLALTADRPPELRGTGANQTSDQVKLFGTAVRWWHELGTPYAGGPDPRDGMAAQAVAWRTSIDRAVAAALGCGVGLGRPGPVHVNVPLRDPLVRAPSPPPDLSAGRPDGSPWTRVTRVTPDANPGPPALSYEPRTLVMLGDLAGTLACGPLGPGLTDAYRRVLAWAEGAGYPVLAEPHGPRGGTPSGTPSGTVLPHARLLAAAPDLLEDLAPQRIVVAGRLTLSRPMAALLRRPDTQIVLACGTGHWADPSHVAHHVVDLAAVIGAPARQAGDREPDPTWLASWRRAADAVHAVVAPSLATEFPNGPAVAAAVLGALPLGARLFLGSSAVPRDAEVARCVDVADVWASRGLAGIDGCVSTAIGLALAAPDVPTYALLGDLTFLHDGNALLIGPDEPQPDLTVVVLNDDGGSIFTTLEYGDPARTGDVGAAEALRRVFTTPTGADLAARCATHRVPHRVAATATDLIEALSRPPSGLQVVEVDARGLDRREYEAKLTRLATDALRGLAVRDRPRDDA